MFCQPKKYYPLLFLLLISFSFYAQEIIEHTVKYGETKYRLSKIYEVSISELERQNPQIVNGLIAGQKLTIDTSYSHSGKKTKGDFIKYMVKPGDTKSGISDIYKVTISELEEANPQIVTELLAYEYIYIPVNKGNQSVQNSSTQKENPSGVANNTVAYPPLVVAHQTYSYNNLLETIKTGSIKKLGFIYPSDFLTDKLLLDFNTGAQIAIDSLKKSGVNITAVHINMASMTSQDLIVLSSVDALISLCDYGNTEKIQKKLKESIPVIYAKPQDNTGVANAGVAFFARSTSEYKQKIMLDYLYGKGNLILIKEEKNVSESLLKNYPGIQVLNTDEYGAVNEDELTEMLVLNKANFVILNTQNTNTIINTTNILLPQTGKYNIQLASFKTDTELTSDKVSNKRYMVLKLIFPQFEGYRLENYSSSSRFYTTYKKKFKTPASEEAIAGFDITFDVISRLFQTQSFIELSGTKTRYVNIAFLYKDMKQNLYVNEAMKIYQLNSQNSVSELN